MDRPELPPAENKRDPIPAEHDSRANHPTRRFSPYRLLLVLAVGFVCLFLFIRVFAVEPFGVPTGSMAPALIGNHREGPCPRCGYPVRVGFPTAGGNPVDHFAHVGCPNCGRRFSLADARDLNGDRVLVDKNVFNLRRPRRWEMAVFRCPDPEPKEFGKPYVKRVIGLPGETISIVLGDVYANGELLRKGIEEVRETRAIVLDMSFEPNPEGWSALWDSDGTIVQGGVLMLDAMRQVVGITYRHWNFDEKKEAAIRAWSSYDGVPRSFAQLPPVHDFSMECDITVHTALEDASFACRLLDGKDSIHAELSVGPRSTGRAVLNHDNHGQLQAANAVGLESGSTHRLEFSFVDRRAILAIDGKVVLTSDLLAATNRGEVRRPLQLGARACKLSIRNLRIFRDTYYTQYGDHGTHTPASLARDEYFMLGDNSGNSQDSRKWPHPGVPEADFVGKPFLIHQPLRPARVNIAGRERVFQTVDWSRLRWLH